MDKETQSSCDEITARNVEDVIRLDRQVREQRTVVMKIVDIITAFSGSLWFVLLHIVWFSLWISWHRLRPGTSDFDPFPYQLLTLIVSLEAILLSTFILISQNRDARLAERRNHLILQLALLSEQENTKMLSMLDALTKHMQVEYDDDPTVKALEQATDTENLAKQIDKGLERLEKMERSG